MTVAMIDNPVPVAQGVASLPRRISLSH